ncbi:kinase-like domain-containing protein [Gigaspora rosea]|uniref:Kinase-like domain-containing protein n=1 Tax=Gigaspora rosea TaxID=44941 RepID=A0A397V4N7_9GLOM|nr:kinase-like domain-containing protein [Gigaspora rosea]
MAKILEELLEKAVFDGHINYLEYDKFTDPTKIGIGEIFKCEWEECELTVVFKCLKVDTDSLDEKSIKDAINELKLLRKVDCHPNIIRFYGVTQDSNGYYNLVLQHADDGTLREYLKSNFALLQWVDKLRIAKEIAFGLSFLHDNNIIHRDLHSKNILIHQGKSKIAGFGPSKQINKTLNSVAHEMLAYVEPQCFTIPKYTRDKKSDIYSFGVILWEISSGSPPFWSFEPITIIG